MQIKLQAEVVGANKHAGDQYQYQLQMLSQNVSPADKPLTPPFINGGNVALVLSKKHPQPAMGDMIEVTLTLPEVK